MSEDKQESPSFLVNLIKQLRNTFSSFLNAIAETITSSVHIPDIAIGPIVGSLITAITTLVIGFVTLSNLFSEQFLYRPLQIQDSNANYTLELERYRQKILTDYLNYATQLMLDYPLSKLQDNNYLLRGITQTVLAEINGERKRYIVMFLKDSPLLNSKNYQFPSSLLEGADLKEAKLDKLDLSSINLKKSDLTKVNLSQTNLHKSNLSQVILINGDLTNADLRGVNLQQADLTNTNLTNACYDKFTLFPTQFNLDKAKMRLIRPFDICNVETTEKAL